MKRSAPLAVRVMEVVHVQAMQGGASPADPSRLLDQFWSRQGELLAEFDGLFRSPSHMAGWALEFWRSLGCPGQTVGVVPDAAPSAPVTCESGAAVPEVMRLEVDLSPVHECLERFRGQPLAVLERVADWMHFGDAEPFAVELVHNPVHSAVGAFPLRLVVRPTQGLRDGLAQISCSTLPPSL